MKDSSRPPAPRGLSPASRQVWRDVVNAYALDLPALRLLRLFCEALDRAAAAQLVLDADGLVVRDRFGQVKAHPMVAVKRDAEVVSARLLRELDIADEPPPDPRPPRR